MSLDLLRRLREVHAFDASPLRHDLGIYHVPFDELARTITRSAPCRRSASRRTYSGRWAFGVGQIEPHRARSRSGRIGDSSHPGSGLR